MVTDQGSEFTISNDILILPEQSVAPDGAFQTNSSAPAIMMIPTWEINANDVPKIGRPFFSAAYLMVDLDAETWTLWQANATTDSHLVSTGGDCAEKPKVNASPPTLPEDDHSTSEGADSNAATEDVSFNNATVEDEPANMISTGSIVGIAVGAAGGAGLLVGALVVCWLKKRRRVGRCESEADIALTKYGHESDQSTPMWYEKSGPSVQELSASQLDTHELFVNERRAEVSGDTSDRRPIELAAMPTPRP